MRPFSYQRVSTISELGEVLSAQAISGDSEYLAGGTTLLDLMKLDVEQPQTVIDINPLSKTELGKIEFSNDGARIGSMVKMAEAAEHQDIAKTFPAVAQSLKLAASAQLRNMATLGGNLLQRTRCTYFRDTSYTQCNKREPGSGCAAIDGFNRNHAVLGVSDNCIASYPGDFAQALMIYDASVEVLGLGRSRSIPISELHLLPDDDPSQENVLEPGELISSISIPNSPWSRRSLYLKIRDRESYEFALASAGVALDMDGDVVRDCRISLGGVASVPWRAEEAETVLKGKRLTDALAEQAARSAFDIATPLKHNAYKIELGKRTLVRAIRQTSQMEL